MNTYDILDITSRVENDGIQYDSYKQYIAGLKHFDVLTREEEYELSLLSHAGDKAAEKKLIECNLRLVVKIAMDYRRAKGGILDLVQEGNVGLMHAVQKYDPAKGIRLSTYAQFWIRAYILKYLMDNHKLVKIGTTQVQRKLFYNLYKERERIIQEGGEPTTEKLAELLNVREKDVCEMEQRLFCREQSLHNPQREGDDICLIDTLEARQMSGDEIMDQKYGAERLSEMMQSFREQLKGRDVEIWDLRMCCENPMTLQELGEHFSISRERARQLESRIMKNLKAHLMKDKEAVDAYELGLPSILN